MIIEVPHFAALRGKEREIVILRSDNGETWKEHTLEATEDAVQDVLQESFDGDELNQLEDLNTNRITRILTTDFPQYFAIVSRIRQEVHAIGPEGRVVIWGMGKSGRSFMLLNLKLRLKFGVWVN